jgi:F-type H+-transporting ATPase subunit a
MSLLFASDNPTHHVMDRPLVGGPSAFFDGTSELTIFGGPAVSTHIVMLGVIFIVSLLLLMWAARRISTGDIEEGSHRYLTKGRIPQLIEVITLYLRDTAIRPVLGKDTDRYLPFLLSLFFFILIANLLGLIPLIDVQNLLSLPMGHEQLNFAVLGGTATSNFNVTLGLALIAFFVIQVHAFKSLGIKGYLHHLTGGAPLYLLPIMVPIELAGMFIKPAALAIRLFANMFAGHTLMAILAMFGVMTWEGTESYLMTGAIELTAVLFAIPISFLELFVAFLQAFIFMFLTTVFIGQMSPHDDHEHDHALEEVPAT